MTITLQIGAKPARNYTLEDDPLSVSVESTQEIIDPGTISYVTDKDAYLEKQTDVRYSDSITLLADRPATFASLNPSKATINSNGEIAVLDDGKGSFLIKSVTTTKRIDLDLEEAKEGAVYSFQNYVSGSLARTTVDLIEGKISGLSPNPTTLQIFSTSDHAAETYARNTNLWLASHVEKLTGICAKVKDWNGRNCITAITRQHFVGARHYSGNTGGITGSQYALFVDAAGNQHKAYLTRKRPIGTTDIMLYRASEPLPVGFHPVKILPVNATDYLPNLKYGVPLAFRNQYGELRIADLRYMEPLFNASSYGMPSTRLPWYRLPVEGDSGSPSLAVIGDDLALIGTWWSASSGPAYHAPDWDTEITAIDAAAGEQTGFRPEVVDINANAYYGTAAPILIKAPKLNETLTPFHILSLESQFSGSPSGYTFIWKRNGTPIAGHPPISIHNVVEADKGTTITCTVTATNAYGSTSATTQGVRYDPLSDILDSNENPILDSNSNPIYS